MSARHQMLDLLAKRQPYHSLEQPFYASQDFFDLDLDQIWRKQWVFAGHSCEVKKPGQFFTLQIGPDPIVIVRGDDGDIHAFYNVCRHRGATLCTQAKGKLAKLVCPYHQWTYGLDGTLLFAGHMPQGFTPSDYRLKPVHIRNVAGWLYVCLADEPPMHEIDAFAETATPYITPHGIENAKVAHEETLIEKGNWKLTMENNRECYHCAVGHPELIRTLTEYDHPEDPRIDPKFKQILVSSYADWEGRGLPYRQVDHRTWRVTRVPFVNGAASMTMDGKPASAKRMGSVHSDQLGSLRMLWLPNNWNHLMADHTVSFRVLPISPTETAVTTKWLVHEDAKEGVDYDIDRMAHVWRQTNKQDGTFVEMTQKGALSSGYRPGPYSTEIEFGVIDFVDWYCDTIETNLGRPKQTPRLAIAAE